MALEPRGPRIVIVGGGAGGLVLATLLGDRLGRRGRAEIVLVDRNLTHVWKPLLHEMAAGTLSPAFDSVIYLGHARHHGFRFVQGRLAGLDRARKVLRLEAQPQSDGGTIPEREVPYDIAVLAMGSISNDFGVPGVAEHCVFLDSQPQAEALQQRLLRDCLKAQLVERRPGEPALSIAIVGAGATGVELAAELHNATRQMVAYGLDRLDPDQDVRLTLIEAAPRVLPALPERLSEATLAELRRLGVEVLTSEVVERVTAEGIATRSGRLVPATVRVWCAGIKAPAVTASLDGLPLDRLGRLQVDDHLRTGDPAIYALGDCAACTPAGFDQPMPPRAQVAYQEAHWLARTIERQLRGAPSPPFRYRDYGSLISLSYSAVGSLMGNLLGTVTVEGRFARLAYVSLYRKHQLTLHGLRWMVLRMLGEWLTRSTQPRLKLH